MSDEIHDEFYHRAEMFGHDAIAVAAGVESISYFTLPSLAEGRRVFSVATPEQRRERLKTFFNPVIAIRARLGQGFHDRGEAFTFADGSLGPKDEVNLNDHLPLHIKAVSVRKKIVRAGEIWDTSVRGEIWGLGYMEELYNTVNVGELVLEPGAKVIVRGNVFSLVCQRLVHVGGGRGSVSDYQIGILPTPFSVDLRKGPFDGNNGSNGARGEDGSDGRSIEVENSPRGLRLVRPISGEEMTGAPGKNGGHGGNGGHGRNGGMCKLAEITLRSIVGHLAVLVQAGPGGRGGKGGNGGDGGHGGHGSDGCKLLSGNLAGGPGGDGGDGGDAGSGGNGGGGGVASNVYVNVPKDSVSQITCISLPSSAGEPGAPGKPGSGGRAGRGGEGPGTVPAARDGRAGQPGKPGRAGRSRSAPWIFLNERVQNPEAGNA